MGRMGFPGQDRLISSEIIVLNQAAVGRNPVALGQDNQISENQLFSQNFDLFAIPDDPGIGRQQLSQRFNICLPHHQSPSFYYFFANNFFHTLPKTKLLSISVYPLFYLTNQFFIFPF